ncbi:MAG TPA: MBL fold metallo-hydrolase [Deltaproteobacteria bacterium]|jgi:glyoxylase-like metal-dependent hydrolase (beta-lactamase superfamily II)|nr:MBL fold metallo-hydrolase [Deltaproteobacteria bacterium]HOI07110.1 MBL fold metallo-hydrolase [Deltaproteobacteria bacterium]
MLNIRQIPTPGFALLSYVITETESRESFIVDPPSDFGPDVDISSLNLKAVINTHTHPDHIMGNRLFDRTVPALAHEAEGRLFQRLVTSSLAAIFTASLPPKISFTLSEGKDLTLGGERIEVLHTPGHSPGSICLYWPGHLVCGDTIFVEGIGRTDIPGGSTAAIKASIARILELPGATRIWPGHYYGGKYTALLDEVSPFLRRILKSI